MPAEILTHWQAFFSLNNEHKKDADKAETKIIEHDDVNMQCTEVMRILNG
ncbi:hypothetical protein [Arsenophonus nasoniae]|uniref:Uncharacterized protein n=1 Tax=Arsenophonus nasoniae TaxID=638 RepID=A0AA95K6A3_9GAMM|nr:hypothetical protein [Arsenophonus nasoniae]WGL93752.1 hypothetical protein QE207_00370 [Arsenophonus nasoniae]WGL96036.1 hypothetical protein QE207_05475 [Arsenophonus nasoniae]